MANLLVDERDVKFVLYEQLDVEQLSNTAKYAEYSKEMYDMVLEQAWKLAENEMAPANRKGDQEGQGHNKACRPVHAPERRCVTGSALAAYLFLAHASSSNASSAQLASGVSDVRLKTLKSPTCVRKRYLCQAAANRGSTEKYLT